MDQFDYVYAAFAYGVAAVILVFAIVRWAIGAICRNEIRKFFKGHVITRRGRGGRFTSIR